MWGILPILLGLVFGWILLAGFGELWFRLLVSNKLWKITKSNSPPQQTPKERVITLSICRTLSALPIILLLWSIEHTQGLGKNLTILTPALLAASLWVYYSNWKNSNQIEKRTRILLESGFFLTLLLGLAIIWGATDILIRDRPADLWHTATMVSGETLPSTNPWLPPYKSGGYYRGQWYSGGLLARLCNLTAAQNYFVSYILAIAWIAYGILSSSWIISKNRATIAFLVLIICLFGSHLGPIVAHTALKGGSNPDQGPRLVGESLSTKDPHKNKLTPIGLKLAELMESESRKTKPNAQINEIPFQPFSYHIMTGEWHSWYGGYLILAILAVAIAAFVIGSTKPALISAAVMGTIAPTSILFNTWVSPLVGIAVLSTLLIGTLSKPKGWFYIGVTLLAAVITTIIIIEPITSLINTKQQVDIEGLKMIATSKEATFTPYLGWLIYMTPTILWVLMANVNTYSKLKYKSMLNLTWFLIAATALTTITIVLLNIFLENLYDGSTLHLGSPLVPIILISIPTMLIAVCTSLTLSKSKISRQCWLSLCASIIFSGTYTLTETLFLDDYLEPPWERWNTMNKWGPSALLLTTMLCAPLALSNIKFKTLKVIAYTLILIITIPPVISWGKLLKNVRTDPDFTGAAWIKKSPAKPIFEHLMKLEKGIVLEYKRFGHDYYTAGGTMPLLTGHQSYQGWGPGFLDLEGPNFKINSQRRTEILKFYKGELENQDKWADQENIDYIVWSISLQKMYDREKEFEPLPKEGKWERAWWLNNQILKDKYMWIETKPRPFKEGLWAKKTRLDSK